MRTFDTFLCNDELDLLEARLTELDEVVYRFVLVESDVTFQGQPKPLHYAENRSRFAAWSDRIIHVDASRELAGISDVWSREYASREAVGRGLDGFSPGADVLLHGDLDEIPRALAVAELRPGEPRVFSMSFRPVAVDLEHPDRWRHTVSAPVSWESFLWLREQRPVFPEIADGGWHLCWLGGPEAMKRKVRQYSHTEGIEAVEREADRCWREAMCWRSGWTGLLQLEHVGISGLPSYITEGRCPESWLWCLSKESL